MGGWLWGAKRASGAPAENDGKQEQLSDSEETRHRDIRRAVVAPDLRSRSSSLPGAVPRVKVTLVRVPCDCPRCLGSRHIEARRSVVARDVH